MTLRKWRSSSSELLDTIPEDLLEKEPTQLIQTPSIHHKVLGLHWDPRGDRFYITTPTLSEAASPTKRQILSDVSQTFDLLGWFSPVIIIIKAHIQKIWSLQLDWDELVPPDQAQTRKIWRSQLHLITETPISRYYHSYTKETVCIQLHGFADSSETVYGGVVYIRTTYLDTTISTALVLAKSRVAPLKTITIPKLELCAALLTSRLLETVRSRRNIDLKDTCLE